MVALKSVERQGFNWASEMFEVSNLNAYRMLNLCILLPFHFSLSEILLAHLSSSPLWRAWNSSLSSRTKNPEVGFQLP